MSRWRIALMAHIRVDGITVQMPVEEVRRERPRLLDTLPGPTIHTITAWEEPGSATVEDDSLAAMQERLEAGIAARTGSVA